MQSTTFLNNNKKLKMQSVHTLFVTVFLERKRASTTFTTYLISMKCVRRAFRTTLLKEVKKGWEKQEKWRNKYPIKGTSTRFKDAVVT